MSRKEMQKYRVFAVLKDNGDVLLFRKFKLLPNRYIQVGNNEPEPIDNYGNWMLLRNDVTEERAYELFNLHKLHSR